MTNRCAVCWGLLLASVLIIVSLWRAPAPSRAQNVSHIEARWISQTRLLVEWHGAPVQSCLYLNDAFIERACGTSGRVELAVAGVDQAYRADPDDVLALSFDRTKPPLATARVPQHVTILPLVVR